MSSPAEGIDALAAEIEVRLPGRVERDVTSGPLVTYRCGGAIALLVRASCESDVVLLSEALRSGPPLPVLVVGRGSNLLVADSGFAGVGLLLGGELERIEIIPGSNRVTAGGAAALPVLARRSAAEGLSGLEFYVGIPGSVGGAVCMNAGGHGGGTSEVLVSARVVDLARGESRSRTVDELDLGYRCSSLKADDVVVEAKFEVKPADRLECSRRIDEIVSWRREHQPGGANAGSVFRNPPGDSAGRLIDSAGLKGLRFGAVEVSRVHANFLTAGPGATATDVNRLVEEVRRRVQEVTGVRLERELRMVGFDPPERTDG